jgi:hypothetical protein
MKIRTGFVSNSSSSSFTVISKKELTEEMIWEAINVPENHPLYKMSKNICKCIFGNAESPDIEELKEEASDGCSYSQGLLKNIEKGLHVYTGYFGDDSSNSVEAFLCMNGISINTDDFELKCEGGY